MESQKSHIGGEGWGREERKEGEKQKKQYHNESSKPGRDVGEEPVRQNQHQWEIIKVKIKQCF